MSARQEPEASDPEAAQSRLKMGLKSCHFILESYRAKLTLRVPSGNGASPPPD
jgi:hypothetical protein